MTTVLPLLCRGLRWKLTTRPSVGIGSSGQSTLRRNLKCFGRYSKYGTRSCPVSSSAQGRHRYVEAPRGGCLVCRGSRSDPRHEISGREGSDAHEQTTGQSPRQSPGSVRQQREPTVSPRRAWLRLRLPGRLLCGLPSAASSDPLPTFNRVRQARLCSLNPLGVAALVGVRQRRLGFLYRDFGLFTLCLGGGHV